MAPEASALSPSTGWYTADSPSDGLLALSPMDREGESAPSTTPPSLALGWSEAAVASIQASAAIGSEAIFAAVDRMMASGSVEEEVAQDEVEEQEEEALNVSAETGCVEGEAVAEAEGTAALPTAQAAAAPLPRPFTLPASPFSSSHAFSSTAALLADALCAVSATASAACHSARAKLRMSAGGIAQSLGTPLPAFIPLSPFAIFTPSAGAAAAAGAGAGAGAVTAASSASPLPLLPFQGVEVPEEPQARQEAGEEAGRPHLYASPAPLAAEPPAPQAAPLPMHAAQAFPPLPQGLTRTRTNSTDSAFDFLQDVDDAASSISAASASGSASGSVSGAPAGAARGARAQKHLGGVRHALRLRGLAPRGRSAGMSEGGGGRERSGSMDSAFSSASAGESAVMPGLGSTGMGVGIGVGVGSPPSAPADSLQPPCLCHQVSSTPACQCASCHAKFERAAPPNTLLAFMGLARAAPTAPHRHCAACKGIFCARCTEGEGASNPLLGASGELRAALAKVGAPTRACSACAGAALLSGNLSVRAAETLQAALLGLPLP